MLITSDKRFLYLLESKNIFLTKKHGIILYFLLYTVDKLIHIYSVRTMAFIQKYRKSRKNLTNKTLRTDSVSLHTLRVVRS